MSEEGKQHAQKADDYNRQASEFIFRANNATGRVDSDTIDLHGQYVEEAEAIVEQRIRYAKSTGQNHLHVIVGKGNHSVNHVQKIKPMVERVCQEEGLQYHTEENAGRIYVNLTGGAAHPPSQWQQPQQPMDQSHPNYGQPQYQTAYPMGGGANYGNNQQSFDWEGQVKKNLPTVLRLLKQCCVVM